MKHLRILLLAAITFTILSSPRQGLASADQKDLAALCPRRLESFGNLQVQQTLSQDQTVCYLGFHPRDAYLTLIYRDYLLTSDGSLLVFNSLSPDEGPTSHGAREFFLYQDSFRGYSWTLSGDTLEVKGWGGRTLKFSTQDAQMIEVEGARIKVDPEVHPRNQGGFEILSSNFFFVDAGFKLGGAPSIDRKRSATLQNSKGDKCQLPNSQVFDVVNEVTSLKPQGELEKAAQKRCVSFRVQN
ncbi:MAG: hypothetical protein ACK5Y2_10930 [Bdellovibrionales bacterium]